MSVQKFKVTKEACGYTSLPNTVLQKLTNLEALGLWCYFQSMPPEWEFNADQIKQIFNLGRDKFEKLLALLKSHNLIETKQNRRKGMFSVWSLHVKNGINFLPFPENTGTVSHRALKNRALVNRAPVNRIHIKETINKENNIKNKHKSFSKDNKKKENEKKHDFAPMMNEAAAIKKHEVIKTMESQSLQLTAIGQETMANIKKILEKAK